MAVEIPRLSQSRKRVFSSVFPTSSLVLTVPTPVATPNLSFVAPGQSFGGSQGQTNEDASDTVPDYVSEKIKWSRAWHTATTFLSIPNDLFELGSYYSSAANLDGKWRKFASTEDSRAIHYIINSRASHGGGDKDEEEDPLVGWYSNEVRRHYLANVAPGILESFAKGADPETSLSSILKSLQRSQSVYLYPLLHHILPAYVSQYDSVLDREERLAAKAQTARLESRFRQDQHSIVAYSAQEGVSKLLAATLINHGSIILGLQDEDLYQIEETGATGEEDDRMSLDGTEERSYNTVLHNIQPKRTPQGNQCVVPNPTEVPESTESRRRILQIVKGLDEVGLGGSGIQRVFAEVMNELMSEYVNSAYAGKWQSPSSIATHLRHWIENSFARFVVEVLNCLEAGGNPTENGARMASSNHSKPLVSLEDVEKWQEMGISRLGRLRVGELFNVIVDWDNSQGAVEDLKHYTTTPLNRTYLITSFASVLSQRLLQPGASTVEILQFYISIIRAFILLDPKGVLLDRVARPLRRYLKDRDDAVQVIVEGLLADVEDENGEPILPGGSVLIELAHELHQITEIANQGDDDGELDWDDMRWVPDPVDAGPGRLEYLEIELMYADKPSIADYKKSKNSDVIGSLISLFDTRDVFVKEFQNIMGERLLKRDFDFDKEIRVLELLKIRFGEGALQACEVMLRDVLDSKRVNMAIRKDQNLQGSRTKVEPNDDNAVHEIRNAPELHAKILSRLFWPALHEETFTIPPEILDLQERYGKGFETLKQQRKLTWLNALGQVTVELDFEDRVVTEDVQTWQASVIYAFQTDDAMSGTDTGVCKTVDDLVFQLSMEVTLVRNALTFWVSKLVLKETLPDTYTVLETLAASTSSGADQIAHQAAIAASAVATTEAATSSSTGAAIRSAEDVATEKMTVYWKFVEAMLTNQGAMPLARIIMMLKFAVPGGFPFAAEELRDFLGRLIEEGRLGLVGGNYRIVA
ncbi:MAG: hypothetical protein M1827_006030 [Pycnora praestabilis]|nr:MAG: hypothetical protein M1827_006030 [Pycnora praestabilis]